MEPLGRHIRLSWKRLAQRLLLGVVAVCLSALPASALTIVDQEGEVAPGGSDPFDVPDTLTGQLLGDEDFAWVHTYAPITETILSATLRIDIIDGDNGFLDMYAGTDTSGTLIGTATGIDHGSPATVWYDLTTPAPGSSDNLIVIGSEHFADLADGTFEIYGDNREIQGEPFPSLSGWGSNRAILTIIATPEPSTGLLLIAGLAGLAGRRRSARRP